MSARYQFSQGGTSEQTVPLLAVDPKVCSIEAGEEARVPPADYAHLKQEYLLLAESIKRLEVENTNLRLTVQFYQDICLDDCA